MQPTVESCFSQVWQLSSCLAYVLHDSRYMHALRVLHVVLFAKECNARMLPGRAEL